MPSSRATASALPRLSPVTMHRLRCPCACSPATASARAGLTRVAEGQQPQQRGRRRGLAPARTRCGPRLRSCCGRAPPARRDRQPELVHQPRAAEQQRAAVDLARDAAPGSALERRRAAGVDRRAVRAAPAPRAPADARCRLQRGGQPQQLVLGHAGDRAQTATSRGLPSVSVPVLSKATDRHRVRRLQRLGILDQDAVPRGRRRCRP